MTDAWSSGNKYEPFIGRWSRLVAREFLQWMSIPSGKRWLDVGCGTGALSETILNRNTPASVESIDLSEEYVNHARSSITDSRIHFHIANAEVLPFEQHSFDAIVSGLVMNFVAQPSKALQEMKRVLDHDGVVGIYLWDYAGKMELLRYFWNSVVALNPSASALDEGRRFPLCNPDILGQLWTEAGLRGIEVRAIDVVTLFKNFTDYWSPFLSGQGPAPGYVASLNEDEQSALRENIHGSLPIAQDETISLIARAWAIKGNL